MIRIREGSEFRPRHKAGGSQAESYLFGMDGTPNLQDDPPDRPETVKFDGCGSRARRC